MLFRKKETEESLSKKPARTWPWYLFGLLLLVLLGFKLWQLTWSDAVVSLKDTSLHVLVADNPFHIYRGLGKRDSLGEYDGMIFLMGRSEKHGFVMRDMRFPIDIVWLEQGTVIDFVSSVHPEPGTQEQDLIVYYPRKEANVVLELPAGWAEAHDLRIGDILTVIEE